MRATEHRAERARGHAAPRVAEELERDGRPEHRALVHLQRSAGNRAVAGALRDPALAHRLLPGRPPPAARGGVPTVQRAPRTGTAPRGGGRATAPARGTPKVTVDMAVPSTIPPVTYSATMKPWELAVFQYDPDGGTVVVGSRGALSFVSEVTYALRSTGYELLVAREVGDRCRGKHEEHVIRHLTERQRTQERQKWCAVETALVKHAVEHFARYRAVVERLRKEFANELGKLPTAHGPARMPEPELKQHVADLFKYFKSRLAYELWKTTCEWDERDYPKVFEGTGVQGYPKLACGDQPALVPLPVLVRGAKPQPKQKPKR